MKVVRTKFRLLIAGGSLAVAITPAPAFASDFCSDVSYILGLKGKLSEIATGPTLSPRESHDIPGAAEQRTTFNIAGAYRCGLKPMGNGEALYMCDFASGGQSLVNDELASCYPAVTPSDAGEGGKSWPVGDARIEVMDYGAGYNVNLTIWPPSDPNNDDDWF